MTKLEFIKWLERFTDFQEDFTKDNCWKEKVKLDLNWYDYIQIEDDLVIFKWDDFGYKHFRSREFTFKDFIYKYENRLLKYGN